MASEIEPLVSTEVHRILKVEWLSAYVEAHEKAFSVRNILGGFRGTGIRPFNPSKVIDRIAPISHNSTKIHSLTPVKVNTPYLESVFTSSPLYTNEVRQANAALLEEIKSGEPLSTPARNYAQCVVRRSERSDIRNIIVEEKYEKLRAEVTKKKKNLSGKRQVIDRKHVLTQPEILSGIIAAEKNTKKRKTPAAKKGKREARKVKDESIDESEASQDEGLEILDCIVVKS
jgi:DNA-binding protein H-NS